MPLTPDNAAEKMLQLIPKDQASMNIYGILNDNNSLQSTAVLCCGIAIFCCACDEVCYEMYDDLTAEQPACCGNHAATYVGVVLLPLEASCLASNVPQLEIKAQRRWSGCSLERGPTAPTSTTSCART